MLSEFERRALRDIEGWVEREDPEFAARLRDGAEGAPWHGDGCRVLAAVAVAGMAVSVVGVVVGPAPLSLYGVCLALTACWLRVVASWMERGEGGG